MSTYQGFFRIYQPNYDPRHIEAYIRLEYGTFDHLSADKLKKEAKLAAQFVDYGGKDSAESLAQSFGL